MGALSRALLVSNGNVTQLVQKLAKDGLVRIAPSPADRRASIVRLTAKGRADFAGLAAAHHDWIDGLLAGMDGERARNPLSRAWASSSARSRKDRPLDPETFQPAHFKWEYADGVATVTLNRPERKNPLTFESYAELRDTFRALVYVPAGQGGGRRRRRRQFQLGRRRPRDHRPADREWTCPACSTSPG